jgi:hypothetical protein
MAIMAFVSQNEKTFTRPPRFRVLYQAPHAVASDGTNAVAAKALHVVAADGTHEVARDISHAVAADGRRPLSSTPRGRPSANGSARSARSARRR